jgi:hypothetical protein
MSTLPPESEPGYRPRRVTEKDIVRRDEDIQLVRQSRILDDPVVSSVHWLAFPELKEEIRTKLRLAKFAPGLRLMNSRGGIHEVVGLTVSKSQRVGYILRRVVATPGRPPTDNRPLGGTFFADRRTVEDSGQFKCLEKETEKSLCV